jgi:ribonuclease HI
MKPSGVFTSEMSGIFVALIHIRAGRPGRYHIVTDSMTSLKALHTLKIAPRTHPLVYEIKEACLWLKNNRYEIHMMWIPLNGAVRGNERADQLAGDAVENGIEWHAPVRLFDWKVGSMLTLFGLWFHLCIGLGVLTATES